MASIGLSVPPGLTISTEACEEYQKNGKKLPDGLWEEVLDGLRIIEDDMGCYLGDPSKPLLLSVRSGAEVRRHPSSWSLCVPSYWLVLEFVLVALSLCVPPFLTAVCVIYEQISMPGMMDTVLNLGLNDEVAGGLAAKSGERFAYDSYRRFLDMFGDVVSIFIAHAGLVLCIMEILGEVCFLVTNGLEN